MIYCNCLCGRGAQFKPHDSKVQLTIKHWVLGIVTDCQSVLGRNVIRVEVPTWHNLSPRNPSWITKNSHNLSPEFWILALSHPLTRRGIHKDCNDIISVSLPVKLDNNQCPFNSYDRLNNDPLKMSMFKIPRTYKYVTLHVKTDVTGVIKLRILR